MISTTTTTTVTTPSAGSNVAVPFPQRFDEEEHLVLYRVTSAGVRTTLTEGVHYSVAGTGDEGGGTITVFTVTAGDTIIASREVDITQQQDYVTNDRFPAAGLETQLDKQIQIDQQLNNGLGRAIKVLPGEPNPVVSARADRESTFPVWDGSGDYAEYTAAQLLAALPFGPGGLTTGTAIWPDDSARASKVPLFAGQVGVQIDTGRIYTATGTTAGDWRVANATSAKVFNVLNYGAVGDGVVDDTPGVKAAAAAAILEENSILYFPHPEVAYTFKTFDDGDTSWTITGAGASLHYKRIISLSDPVIEWVDAAARAASTPTAVGKVGYQVDTGDVYVATGTTAGAWTLRDSTYTRKLRIIGENSNLTSGLWPNNQSGYGLSGYGPSQMRFIDIDGPWDVEVSGINFISTFGGTGERPIRNAATTATYTAYGPIQGVRIIGGNVGSLDINHCKFRNFSVAIDCQDLVRFHANNNHITAQWGKSCAAAGALPLVGISCHGGIVTTDVHDNYWNGCLEDDLTSLIGGAASPTIAHANGNSITYDQRAGGHDGFYHSSPQAAPVAAKSEKVYNNTILRYNVEAIKIDNPYHDGRRVIVAGNYYDSTPALQQLIRNQYGIAVNSSHCLVIGNTSVFGGTAVYVNQSYLISDIYDIHIIGNQFHRENLTPEGDYQNANGTHFSTAAKITCLNATDISVKQNRYTLVNAMQNPLASGTFKYYSGVFTDFTGCSNCIVEGNTLHLKSRYGPLPAVLDAPSNQGTCTATVQTFTGTHDDLASNGYLKDAGAPWIPGELVGWTLRNTTTGAATVVTENSYLYVHGILSGGSSTLWAIGDAYELEPPATALSDTNRVNAAGTGGNFDKWVPQLYVGWKVFNTTDGSEGVVVSNSSQTIVTTLSGGADDTWDSGVPDAYTLVSTFTAFATQASTEVFYTNNYIIGFNRIFSKGLWGGAGAERFVASNNWQLDTDVDPDLLGTWAAISSITNDGATWTVTTASSHGFTAADSVVIKDSSVPAYDGTHTVATVVSTTVYTITNAATPASATDQGYTSQTKWSIQSITASGTLWTVTTVGTHPFTAADKIRIVGSDIGAYNGGAVVNTTPTTTTFTIADTSTPGTATDFGIVAEVNDVISTADQGTWFTDGTNMLYPNTGNIGINTDDPTAKLHVNGTFTVECPSVAAIDLIANGIGTPYTTTIKQQSYYGALEFVTPGSVGENSNIIFKVGAAGETTSITEKARITSTGIMDSQADRIRVRTINTPGSATATGTKGDICWDTNYIYICIATNIWQRVAHATW